MIAENYLASDFFAGTCFPRMLRVRQTFPRPRVQDVKARLNELLSSKEARSGIRPGMRIAITCGSRGITDLPEIITAVCAFVKECGAYPFLLPCMGSHGGACIEGQRELLTRYGITEASCGAPVLASVETAVLAHMDNGEEVRINRLAAEADGIILVNRIKAHTDFRGRYESGLMKMMVVGLGGPRGAQSFHAFGAQYMAARLESLGGAILKNSPILFGVAILENAYDETAQIELIPADHIPQREPALLQVSRELLGHILFQDVDLLIVERIGKDISGDGMDPNVTGRFSTAYADGGLRPKKCAVLDLSDGTMGNMVGIGMADTTTYRCVQKCDLQKSYPNAFTCTVFDPFKFPLIMKNDRDAIAACLMFCGDNDKSNPRVVRILDTSHLCEIWISEALEKEAKENPAVEICSAAQPMLFDKNGRIL